MDRPKELQVAESCVSYNCTQAVLRFFERMLSSKNRSKTQGFEELLMVDVQSSATRVYQDRMP